MVVSRTWPWSVAGERHFRYCQVKPHAPPLWHALPLYVAQALRAGLARQASTAAPLPRFCTPLDDKDPSAKSPVRVRLAPEAALEVEAAVEVVGDVVGPTLQPQCWPLLVPQSVVAAP